MAYGGGNVFGDMFKNFPITTIILMIVFVYIIWRSTGGIERGEERRATGQDGIFIEVTNVPDSYGNREFFSAYGSEEITGESVEE